MAAVGAAAVGAIAEKPELFGRVIILVGLAEGIAIYGVIVSVLILNRLDLMTFCAFIGDEVSAAGFRLAGVDVHVPGPERRRICSGGSCASPGSS